MTDSLRQIAHDLRFEATMTNAQLRAVADRVETFVPVVDRHKQTVAKLWQWADNFDANIRHYAREGRSQELIQSTQTRYNDIIDVLALLAGETPETIRDQHTERQVTRANG